MKVNARTSAIALLVTAATGAFLLAGCAAPAANPAPAQQAGTAVTVTAPAVTVTSTSPVVEDYVVPTSPRSTTAFNPNGVAQYVGIWVENWSHGATDGAVNRYVVTESGGSLTISCTTNPFIFSNIKPSSGTLTFHQSLPAVSNYGSEVDYTLYRSGDSLVGTAMLSQHSVIPIDISWTQGQLQH